MTAVIFRRLVVLVDRWSPGPALVSSLLPLLPSVFGFTGSLGQAVSTGIENDVKPYCPYCCRLGSELGRVCCTLLNVCALPLTNTPHRQAVHCATAFVSGSD